MCSGIQGGKTFGGAIWLRNLVTEINSPNCNFLVTAPTTKIFHQATEPAFLRVFQNMGEYNHTRAEFNMGNDRIVYLRTLHEPNAIEGITDCYGGWEDECGMYKRPAQVNFEGRMAFKQAPSIGTTTPYALNWMYKDVYKPWKAGELPDVEFVQFPSIANPYFPREEFERQKRMLDPRVFSMKYEGQFERMAGLVYFELTEDNWIEPQKLNKRDWYIVGGIDFGFTNPLGMVIRALHRTEPFDWQMGEFYRSYLDTNSMIKNALMLQKKAGVELFYADSEDPQGIIDLQRAGVRVVPVTKYKGSVLDGIREHNALIKSREYKLFRGKCPNTEDEYETYHWPEDEGKEENMPEKPVDAHNHLMRANEYVSRMTKEFRYHRQESQKPKVISDLFEYENQRYGIHDPEMVEDWYDD